MSTSGVLTPPLAGENFVPFSRPATPGSVADSKIAFVGLGKLGNVMATNLATWRASHIPGSPPLLVWNRTVSKSEALAKQVGADKVEVAQNLAQVVQVADLIITNLANDTVVETVYDEFDKALAVRCISNSPSPLHVNYDRQPLRSSPRCL
jgi:molybdopterin/thiamine biosynthesis adenylyltransferase